jgi:hypothetical protein
MQLVSSFEDLVQQISWVMTTPTAASFLIVLAGWLFARRHTVTGALVAAGEVRRKHHSAFHRVFASARWSPDAMGLALLALAWPLAAADGTIFLVLDDTLARKRGRKVFGVGMHHDPLISSRGRSLVNWGHSWVILSVLGRLRPYSGGQPGSRPPVAARSTGQFANAGLGEPARRAKGRMSELRLFAWGDWRLGNHLPRTRGAGRPAPGAGAACPSGPCTFPAAAPYAPLGVRTAPLQNAR